VSQAERSIYSAVQEMSNYGIEIAYLANKSQLSKLCRTETWRNFAAYRCSI